MPVKRIVSIVEGDGEVQALPVLFRRIAAGAGIFDTDFPQPIRVRRDRFLQRHNEFSRVIELAARKAAPSDRILILLDADEDCAVNLAQDIAVRASTLAPHRLFSVVIAVLEFEAWFLASAQSIAGGRGLQDQLVAPPQPELIRDAKGWLSERMVNGRYHEVSDQPALAQIFDIGVAAAGSRSFRKFLEECQSALA